MFSPNIFIFDNNSKKLDHLKKLDIEIHFNKINKGYAFAINFFIKKYINQYDWFCMLDQDSILDLDYFNYINEHLNQSKLKLGLIGSNIIYKSLNKNIIEFKNQKKFHEKETLICSGTLINKYIIKKNGYLNEKLFMEYIDVEYCLRVQKNGYKNYITHKPFLIQEFGENKSNFFFGRRVNVDNHEPIRYFYRSRNFKYCLSKYFLSSKKECLLHLYNFIKMYIKVILYEEQKIKKTYYLFKGFFTKI